MVSVMRESLQKRHKLLQKTVLPKLPEPVRYSAPLDADLPVLFQSVRYTFVAKRCSSAYNRACGLAHG